jgi:hypothetical protein
MPRFVSRTPFDPSHPDALAVYCSDGRFTRAVEDLLSSLGYPRLDTLTIAGGPGLLEITSATLSSLEATRSSVSFLITGHKIQHVVLVAHAGCGYYRAHFPYESPEAVLRRQLADLRGAARWIRDSHGNLEVTKFYARPGNEGVEFEPVE